MKSFSAQLASSLLKRNQTPGFSEICSVINLDDEPCVLVDRDEKTLLFINSRMIRFSGYSSDFIRDKPLEILFPQIDLNSITSGETSEIQVNRKDKPLEKVQGRFNFLDEKSHWLRIRFTDPDASETESKPIEASSIEKMLEFAKLADCESLQLALTKSADIVQQVTGVDAVCIYLADPLAPQFTRVAEAGMGESFPEILPSLDLMRLSEAFIWNPGMRILTELHRFGRINEYRYVGSVPLGEQGATVGLIICGGKDQKPALLTLELLNVIAGQVWAVQQHYSLVENLQKENRSFARMVNLLDASFNNIAEGIVLLSPDLTIQHINPAAELILGYTSEEVQGQEYENVLIGTDRISPALEEARKGVTTHNIGKVTLNRRDGQAFPALVYVLPVMMKDNLIGIELILDDVSENENNKTLNQHLEHRAVLGDYTAAFAHDIRNPINNIYTGIQLLAAKLDEHDPNQEIIERIQGDCTRLNHQMESFLAFSRPTDLHLEPIEIGQFLKRTLDRWHPRLMRANITPILQVEEKIDKIKGDPRALDRVFTNLISNAVDAMSSSGDTLAIKAAMNLKVAEVPMIEITVSDNGPGIPDDIKERIFEPFVSNSQKGTGLGLAITKQIVTAHKGSINVKSFAGGTVFIVNIPACNGECE